MAQTKSASALNGYCLNTAVVPLLAFAGRWEVAAGWMIAERTGKAIRTPPRDVLLSHAATQVGRGFGFGLHEAMDQIGAVMGPLAVAAVLYWQGGYRGGFAILIVPGVLGLCVLVVAQRLYPNPRDFEQETVTLKGEGLPRVFWIYLGAVALVAAGYADFPLIAYHFQKRAILTTLRPRRAKILELITALWGCPYLGLTCSRASVWALVRSRWHFYSHGCSIDFIVICPLSFLRKR
jgi:MFS family permease